MIFLLFAQLVYYFCSMSFHLFLFPTDL